MIRTNRRRFLKLLGGAAAGAAIGAPVLRALAEGNASSDEFFIFIHQQGGWDVTVWADPRNQKTDLIDPATSNTVNKAGIEQWVDEPFNGGEMTFKLVQPTGSNLVFGPAIGKLAAHYDKLSLINGVAMNTVSHPDGAYFSSTGRHLAGGHPAGTSIDVVLANELGVEQLMPDVSVLFPSAVVDAIDARARPLAVGSIETVARSLFRSDGYETPDERDAVTLMLTEEATDLAKRSYDPTFGDGFAVQLEALRKLVAKGADGASYGKLFDLKQLAAAQKTITDYSKGAHGRRVYNAAFAVEAMKANIVRCVSFGMANCDHHGPDYKNVHLALLQDTFNVIAALVEALEVAPHPTKIGDTLLDHTHILVISEFCRTPKINASGGRDHHPNNSSLVISPRWKGNHVFGATDPGSVLPVNAGTFADGTRAVTPADVLATLLGGVGIDPRKYMRDGDVVKELLV